MFSILAISNSIEIDNNKNRMNKNTKTTKLTTESSNTSKLPDNSKSSYAKFGNEAYRSNAELSTTL